MTLPGRVLLPGCSPAVPSACGRGSPCVPKEGHCPSSVSADLETVLRVLCARVVCLGVSVACYLNFAELRLLKRSQYLHRLLQLKLLEGWGRYCACRVAFSGEQLSPSPRGDSSSRCGHVVCSQPPPTAVGCTDSGSHSKSQCCDAVAAEHGAQPHGCPIGAKDPMGPAVPGRSRKDVPGRSVLCCPVCPTDVFDF